jgi:queuosine precursor transporter
MRMLIAAYIAAMVTANLLVWWLGPWSSPFIAFVLIGLDLTLRDVMHDRLNRWQMLAVVLTGGALTWLLNPSAANIAIASATAFSVSALADWTAYTLLRNRPWLVRSNGSNVVGSAVDSVIFPLMAFGTGMGWPKLLSIIATQFACKVGGGAVWAWLIRKRFAVGAA